MTEIPSPIDTGSSGTQQAVPEGTAAPEVSSVLPSYGMTTALVGIANDRSKSIGGPNMAALISGYATQMHYELHAARSEVAAVRQELRTSDAALNKEKTAVAVLKAHISAGANVHKFQLIAVTIGSFLVTTAIELYKNELVKLAVAVGLLGAALVAVGWFWPQEGAE